MPRPALFCPAQRSSLCTALAVLLLCAAGALPVATQAETHNQLWSVHAFGLKVGELQVAVQENGRTYQGNGAFRTTGLAGVLRRIRFTVKANGQLAKDALRPKAYDGFIDTGKRVSETSLRAQNGLLIKTKGAQDPAVPIAPSATNGAYDPLSMMWLTLRDQTERTLCNIEQTQFDGTRLVRITLRTRTSDGDRVTCSGTYDRIGGYSAEELAELKTSPLSITYAPDGHKWRAEEVRLASRHGKAKVIRQE